MDVFRFVARYVRIVSVILSTFMFSFSLILFFKSLPDTGQERSWKFYCSLGGLMCSALILFMVIVGFIFLALIKGKNSSNNSDDVVGGFGREYWKVQQVLAMKRYLIFYIILPVYCTYTFFVLLRSIETSQTWRIVAAVAGFMLTLLMTVCILIRLRAMKV